MKKINEDIYKIKSLMNILTEAIDPKDWKQGDYYISYEDVGEKETPFLIIWVKKIENNKYTVPFIYFNENTKVRTEEKEFESDPNEMDTRSLNYQKSTGEKWNEIIGFNVINKTTTQTDNPIEKDNAKKSETPPPIMEDSGFKKDGYYITNLGNYNKIIHITSFFEDTKDNVKAIYDYVIYKNNSLISKDNEVNDFVSELKKSEWKPSDEITYDKIYSYEPINFQKNFHTDVLKSEFDYDLGVWNIIFTDGVKYFGSLDTNNKISGSGKFVFENGNTLKGVFKTVESENGVTYSMVLKNNKELANIFDYSDFKNISDIRTLGGIENGASSDKNYCKRLKNFYLDYFKDIKDGYIVNNDLQIIGSDLENKKRIIKECYNFFPKIFSNDEISQLQNLSGDYEQYKITLIENFKSIIKKFIFEEKEKKERKIIERKIIENRFNYIVSEETTLSIKKMIKEKNILLNLGYDKELVNDIYNNKKTSSRRRF